MRDKGSRVKIASVTGRVARCVMARRTVARLVFGIEHCSILCDFDARQSRVSKTRNKIADVALVLVVGSLLGLGLVSCFWHKMPARMMLNLLSSVLCQAIGWEERLRVRNDLFVSRRGT